MDLCVLRKVQQQGRIYRETKRSVGCGMWLWVVVVAHHINAFRHQKVVLTDVCWSKVGDPPFGGPVGGQKVLKKLTHDGPPPRAELFRRR
jgi:hypothetical protein